jgi:membrane carboxypeptidase/penicillin-binding protein
VHGQSVAGATFPVPIWHEYMAAALWNRPAIDFQTPSSYPTFQYFHKGYFGPVHYYAPPVTTTTTTTTTTTANPPGKSHGKPPKPSHGLH